MDSGALPSSSKRAPLKTAKFESEADRGFADAAGYRDWQFTFVPGTHRRKVP